MNEERRNFLLRMAANHMRADLPDVNEAFASGSPGKVISDGYIGDAPTDEELGELLLSLRSERTKQVTMGVVFEEGTWQKTDVRIPYDTPKIQIEAAGRDALAQTRDHPLDFAHSFLVSRE